MPPSSPSGETSLVIDAVYETDTDDVLDVRVPAAQVRLHPHDHDGQVQIHGWAPDTDADEGHRIFDRYGVAAHQAQDRLHVFGDGLESDVEDWRWHRANSSRIHLDISLPPHMAVDLHLQGGSADVSGLDGDVDVHASGGTLVAARLGGSVRVRGGAGRFTLQDSSLTSVEIEWAAGPVNLHALEVEALETVSRSAPTTIQSIHGPTTLSVHGAPLTVGDIDGPCEAIVRGGELHYQGAPTERTSLTTVGGMLHTLLPQAHSAALSLAGETAILDEAFSFEGEESPQEIEGCLNGGGPPLRLRAVRGTARCSAQDEA